MSHCYVQSIVRIRYNECPAQVEINMDNQDAELCPSHNFLILENTLGNII